MNNSESYLAGDFKHVTGDLEKSSVTFGLHNGAVWYPAEAEYTNSTDLEHQLVEFKLDGGVIDIYHSQPELVRDDADTDRTFTLKNINDAVSGTDGVTSVSAAILRTSIIQGWLMLIRSYWKESAAVFIRSKSSVMPALRAAAASWVLPSPVSMV